MRVRAKSQNLELFIPLATGHVPNRGPDGAGSTDIDLTLDCDGGNNGKARGRRPTRPGGEAAYLPGTKREGDYGMVIWAKSHSPRSDPLV